MRTVTLGADRGISARARAGRRMKPYLFILPILVFAVGFVYYPFFRTFLYSFSAVNVMGEITAFAGFDNYRYLFSRREFGTALSNTLRLTVMNVPLTMAFTLLLGRLLKEKRFLGGLFETLIAATMAVSMGSAALTFRVMLNPTVGWINSVLGIGIRWYEDRNTALYGILLVLVYTITLDKLLAVGASRTKLEIVSREHEAIRKAILEDLDRSVTLLHGQTGYFGLETDMLYVDLYEKIQHKELHSFEMDEEVRL